MPDYMDLADRSWPVLTRVMALHSGLYRLTRGLLGHGAPGLPPMLLLDHVGAKSGNRRTAPLVYMPDGERFVVVAAKGGHPRNPAWVHNLRANPYTEAQIGPRRVKVIACEADDQQRRQLWPRAIQYNPLWERYQRRTRRTIPLFVLSPL